MNDRPSFEFRRNLGDWELTSLLCEGFPVRDRATSQVVVAQAFHAYRSAPPSDGSGSRAIVWTADHPAVKRRLLDEYETLRRLRDEATNPSFNGGQPIAAEVLDGDPQDGWFAVERLEHVPLTEVATSLRSAGRPLAVATLHRFSRSLWRSLRAVSQSKENRTVHWCPTPDRIFLARSDDSWDWDRPILDRFTEYGPLSGVASEDAEPLPRPYMPPTTRMNRGAMLRYWALAVLCLSGGIPAEDLARIWAWSTNDGDRLPLDTVPPSLRRTVRRVVAPSRLQSIDPIKWILDVEREIREDAGTQADARAELDGAVLDLSRQMVASIQDRLPADQVKKLLVSATDAIADIAASSTRSGGSAYELAAAVKLLHARLELDDLVRRTNDLEQSSGEARDLLGALKEKIALADRLQMDNHHLHDKVQQQAATIELLQDSETGTSGRRGLTDEVFEARMIDITSSLDGPLYKEATW